MLQSQSSASRRPRLTGIPLSPGQVCQQITDRVATDFGLEASGLLTRNRGTPRTAFARQVAMYLAHVGFGLSFESIGRVFGRDRTTVSHACRVVEDSRDDLWLDCRLAVLERACGVLSEPNVVAASQGHAR